jgi:hypothetical protein
MPLGGTRVSRAVRRRLERAVASRGYLLVKDEGPAVIPGAPAGVAAPTAQDARLQTLRARYAAHSSARSARSHWTEDRLRREVDLTSFRGDNLYVWQDRNTRVSRRARMYLHTRDVADRSDPTWLARMGEDGAFGAHVHTFDAFGPVSRDLVDSIVELDFLARHVPRLQDEGAVVVDVGAGYGRLAHRAPAVLPGLDRWCCVDAIPESTYLSEYYLSYRGVLHPEGPAEVVPLDELEARFERSTPDLLVNVHSFSEMPLRAVRSWVEWAGDHGIPHIFVVPNEPGEPAGLEPDGSRPPLLGVFAEAKYEPTVVEPVIADPDVRGFVGIFDRMWLFERT